MSSRTNLKDMGKHIAELRKAKGYTQKELSELLDVSDKTISKWECGDIAPDITILQLLAKELNTTIEDILCAGIVNKEEKNKSINNKKKLIKEVIICILLILSTITFMFNIEGYYKWNVTRLRNNKEVLIDGYLITNKKESKIIIQKLLITNSNIGYETQKEIEEYRIIIYNEEEAIYSKTLKNDINNEIIEKENIIIDNLKKINKKDLKIKIELKDNKQTKMLYKIEF